MSPVIGTRPTGGITSAAAEREDGMRHLLSKVVPRISHPPLSISRADFLFSDQEVDMDATQLRQMYFEFFQERGHTLIGSAPLIPRDDASVLFTAAGMQPLAP